MAFFGNVTAVLGANLASALGRKGTVSDVTLYNNKTGDVVLSFVEPTSYPDKIQPLVSALNMADQVLFKVDSLDASFAEKVIAIDAAGMERGYLIVPEPVSSEKVNGFIADTALSGYETVEEQVVSVREKLAEYRPSGEGSAVVQVDHSFTVRGVGTVVLGVVRRGVIRKYDEVRVCPGDKTSVVKSIQVHDTDVSEALPGARVGLSLKNLEPEDAPRGSLICVSEVKASSVLEVDVSLSKYSPRGLKEGDVFMVNCCLNYVPAKVESGSASAGGSGRLSLKLEKDIPLFGERVLLLDPGQKMPRVFGFGKI